MGFNDEYLKLRKKRLEEEESKSTQTVAEWRNQNKDKVEAWEKRSNGSRPVMLDTLTPQANSDIAPVKQTSSNPIAKFLVEKTTKFLKDSTDERKWFEKGAFEDGYQFGDITRTIFGTSKDAETNLMTGIVGMGEKAVDALATLAPYVNQAQWNMNGGDFAPIEARQAFTQANELAKKDIAEFVEKDLYDEEAVAKTIVTARTPLAWFDKSVMDESTSVLGEKSDELIQSAGQLAATSALTAAGVPAWLTMGATTFGGEAENAFKQGATYDEATVSAAISAGAEVLTERLGGISFGNTTVTDLATNMLAANISEKTLQALIKFGLDASAEGFEEVFSNAISAVGQKITYDKDKNISLGELFLSEEAFDNFIGGFVLGGGSNVIGGIKNNAEGKDIVTEMDKNEQKVVDKVFNDAVAEAEEGGKKLSAKEKTNLYNEVVNKLEKGYIDTDTIEEVLGEDVYKSYKDTIDYEDDILKQYEELGKKTNPTLAEMSLYDELKSQYNDIKQNSQREAIKSRLSEEVFGKVKDTKLAESYNERARRGQHYEADLSQYDEKQQEVIKRAVDSGILNNTNRTHEFVDLIAKISADKGVPFDFTNNAKLKESGFAIDGAEVNGFVTKDGISINIDSHKALQSTVGHEITHVLEGTELYAEMQKALFDYAKSKGDFDGRRQSLAELYKDIKDADVDAELTADLVGDYLFTDEDFVKHLSTQNRNVFQKMYDEIKYLWKLATAGSKEARELEKVKREFEKAYRESGKASEGTKYSFSGVNANGVNSNQLAIAEQMETEGKTSEEIRQETGWFRSYDGKWRYEIDDSEAVWHFDTAKPNADRLFNFGERVYKLEDILEHDELYKAYPQLRDVSVYVNPFAEFGGYVIGRNTDGFTVKSIEDDLSTKWTFIHEIQHLIQNIEGFGRGASRYEYSNKEWGDKEYDALNERKEIAKKLYAILRRNGVSISKDAIDYNQYSTDVSDEIIESNYFTLQSLGSQNKRTQSLIDAYYEQVQKLNATTPEGQYHATAGEIEAYDAQARMRMSAEERKATRPNIDRNDAIVKYSLGYHAGDLGKAESLGSQSGGRDTGHYGTGTYFVGDEVLISDSTYGKRPHEAVDFDKYNLYQPKTAANAGMLHNFLKGVNEYYDRDTNLVSSDEEIEAIKEQVDELRYEEVTSETLEKAINLVSKVAGKYHTNDALWSFLGDVSQGGDGTFYNGDTPMTLQEVAKAIKDKDYAVYKLERLLNESYITRRIWRYQEWNESVADAADMLGISESRAREIISEIRAEIDAAGYDYNGRYTADSASTRFMKALGYEGVDVRGIKGYDNTMYGSVIYDLKGEDLARKKEIGTAKYSISDKKSLDKYSQKQYNDFGWAREADAVTENELDDMYSKIHEKGSLKKFAQTKYGESVIEVNDSPHIIEANNTFVFVKGSKNSPEITRVVRVNFYDEASIDVFRKDIYENTDNRSLEAYARVMGEEIVQYYDRSNSASYREYSEQSESRSSGSESKGNQRVARRWDLGDTTDAETQSNEIAPIKASSNDGVFFDGENADIRFSLSKSVEETKDLIAMHNVSEAKLKEALKLGGLPSPSVAITKKDIAHDNYGGITLLLQKDAIDPQADSRNKVYGSDAWTPTISNARTEYEIDFEKMRAFEKKLAELGKKVAGGAFSSDSLVRRLGIEDVSEQNVAQLAERLAKHDEVRAAYLAEMGQTIEPEYKEKVYNKYGNKALQTFIDTVGVERLATLAAESELGNTDAIRAEEETVRKIIRDTHAERSAAYLKRRPEMREKLLDGYMENVSFFTIEDFVNNAWQFYEEGGAVTTEIDRLATSEKVRQAVSDADVSTWLEPQIAEFFGEPGIYNGKDPYTADGRSRSFAETHYTYTAENIVKAMYNASARGVGTFGANANSIIATATPSYNSIEEIHADKGRLKVEVQETYNAILSDIDNALNDVEHDIMRTTKHHADNTFDEEQIIGSIITEAATGTRTVSAVKRAFAKEGYTITTEQAQKVLALYNKAANVPTGYFEAKPERVVGFNEVAAFIIPNNTDVKLKQELLNAGYNIAEYDPNVEGDRKRVVNQFEDYTFSLSNVGEPQKRYGNYNIYGKDVRYEAPMQEGVSKMETTTPTVSKTETVEDVAPVALPDEFAPIPEAEANAMQSENIAHIDDADAPPEMEAPYYGETQDAAPIDPFEDRDMKEVSRDRKTPAYMYENPEVKPFFQAEANILLGELERVEKPETIYNGWLKYEMTYEGAQDIPEIYRTERIASDTIVYLRDTIGMSYADIEKGLKAIIEDNGAENIAAAKKLEFVINDRLLYGYQDFYGYDIPANQDYINLLTEKEISEYSDEARKQFFEVADAYDPMADIAPVAENKAAPVKEKYEAIKPPKQTKEPSMKRVKDADDIAPTESKTAEIYDTEPDTGKKKSRGWARFRANFLDKQSVFEDLALKTNNRELMGKANYILSAEQRAQRLIGNGKSSAGVKSLNDIRVEVESTGKTKQFYEYLYHRHNIDRMSLEEGKPVFGDSVTADVSRAEVAKYEAANPKFTEYAQDVYDYMNYLRDQMVESGVISQETADLWAQMYPHYVPIRRLGDTGLNINVPLDTGRTGVNAPIKKATGGSRDILPLFDTMALRTEQTYKAIAKNNFGVELKNTLGSTIESAETNLDEMIDSVDAHEELLKKGENGRNPTFTVFEDGKKVTFEITDDMYDALKPTSDDLRYTNKVANTISNVHRGILTEYNPTFMLTNAIKDAQDILINSQHPAKTYANLPNAIAQMAKNGTWYQEYLENGGESNTYFDGQSNTFTKDDTGIKKIIGMPLRSISAVNNYVERAPRLAEYIASRKAGASAEVAMLDAARVTTNFAAGGDVTKFANRNGFTFLNASVQGAMQQVRNVREAKANGLKGWVQLATKVALAGIPAMILNNLLWDDDEEYEQLSDYVKDNYYVVAKFGDGQFVRIPKGRAMAVIQDALEQVGNALTGDDEVDLANFLELAISNLAPNNPLDNNILAPISQALTNKTWYGDDLVPTRLQDLPAAEQFDESTDSISKWLGEKLNVSPYKLNYLLNQYSGGVGDVVLPMLTPEAESGDNSLIGNMIAPLRDKFTTDSVMNNQNVSDFYDTVDKLTANAKSSYATDEDILKSKYMNSVNAELSELYKQKREIQNSNLADAEKYEAVRDIQKQIDMLAEESLNTYGNVNIDGGYAVVGDLHFRWYEPGEDSEAEPGWQKISDKQLEKQEEVTSGLGIDPSTYWSNKSEYDFAYEYPGKYAVAKSVGGYEKYKTYQSELYDIKADKDENGKSITGSRKDKVADYINGLDISYEEKIILFKSEYNADDTYNYEIIDYLNNRNDISYDEMVAILRELGFTVKGDTITWD